jgi:putative tryptophan/tyrosine transport system substrate-binding protein
VRRREVVAWLGATAAWPLATRAQPALPRVGFLSGRSAAETVSVLAAFHRGLAEAGFVEGKNIAVDYRWAEGRYQGLPALAAELVMRGPAVLAATGGSSAALAAKAATSTIPVVFTIGGDPVKLGLVESLSRPGRNVTGVTLFITEVGAKRLELLRELAPKTSVLGVILNPSYPPAIDEARDVQGYARALGFQVHLLNITREADIEQASAAVAALQITALLVANDPFLIDLRDRLVRVAAEQAIPAVYITREFVEAGGLMSYGADVRDGYRRTGAYVGEILKGAKPADLPVLQPTKLELLLNLRTAKALGISVPLTLQAQADEVIE